jgi:hypothetical protein
MVPNTSNLSDTNAEQAPHKLVTSDAFLKLRRDADQIGTAQASVAMFLDDDWSDSDERLQAKKFQIEAYSQTEISKSDSTTQTTPMTSPICNSDEEGGCNHAAGECHAGGMWVDQQFFPLCTQSHEQQQSHLQAEMQQQRLNSSRVKTSQSISVGVAWESDNESTSSTSTEPVSTRVEDPLTDNFQCNHNWNICCSSIKDDTGGFTCTRTGEYFPPIQESDDPFNDGRSDLSPTLTEGHRRSRSASESSSGVSTASGPTSMQTFQDALDVPSTSPVVKRERPDTPLIIRSANDYDDDVLCQLAVAELPPCDPGCDCSGDRRLLYGDKNQICIDSGATCPITNNGQMFSQGTITTYDFDSAPKVFMGNGEYVRARAIGTMKIYLKATRVIDGSTVLIRVLIPKTLFVPEISMTIMGVADICLKNGDEATGHEVTFSGTRSRIVFNEAWSVPMTMLASKLYCIDLH